MTKNQKVKIGLVGGILGLGGFFFFMQFLHLFGSVIEYGSSSYMLKMAVPFSCLILALYSGAYITGGHKAAVKFAGVWLLLLGFAFTNGYYKNKEQADMNLINSLQPSIEESSAEGRSFDPKKDFVDLVFSVVGEPKEENGVLWVMTEGKIDNKKVGFEVGVSDKTSGLEIDSEGKLVNTRTTQDGVIIKSTGEPSDNLLSELSAFYGVGATSSKMAKNVSFTSVALGDNPARINHREVHFKLFYEKKFQDQNSPEAMSFYKDKYFEVYLNFDLPNGRVYLKEKDQEYRLAQINAFTEK